MYCQIINSQITCWFLLRIGHTRPVYRLDSIPSTSSKTCQPIADCSFADRVAPSCNRRLGNCPKFQWPFCRTSRLTSNCPKPYNSFLNCSKPDNNQGLIRSPCIVCQQINSCCKLQHIYPTLLNLIGFNNYLYSSNLPAYIF